MINACLANKLSYLDVTAEVDIDVPTSCERERSVLNLLCTGHSGIVCANVETRAERNRVILRNRTCYRMSIRSIIARNSDKTTVECTTIIFLLRTWFNDGASIGAAMFLQHISNLNAIAQGTLWLCCDASGGILTLRSVTVVLVPNHDKSNCLPLTQSARKFQAAFLKIPRPPPPSTKYPLGH